MKIALRLVALVSVVVVVAGCGSGDDSDEFGGEATPTPISGAAAMTPTAQGSIADAATPTAQQGTGEPMQWNQPPAMQLEAGKDYYARLTTSKGVMVVDLNESDAPNTVNNFVFLASQGYYTNVPFHRIISGFMVQTGDPTGTGRGGPGYRFADEPITKDYTRGTLAMANSGPNTNGSQFFICHADLSGRLPKNYTIFGQVTEGLDVLDAIASVPVRASAGGELSSPVDPVTLESVEIFTK